MPCIVNGFRWPRPANLIPRPHSHPTIQTTDQRFRVSRLPDLHLASSLTMPVAAHIGHLSIVATSTPPITPALSHTVLQVRTVPETHNTSNNNSRKKKCPTEDTRSPAEETTKRHPLACRLATLCPNSSTTTPQISHADVLKRHVSCREGIHPRHQSHDFPSHRRVCWARIIGAFSKRARETRTGTGGKHAVNTKPATLPSQRATTGHSFWTQRCLLFCTRTSAYMRIVSTSAGNHHTYNTARQQHHNSPKTFSPAGRISSSSHLVGLVGLAGLIGLAGVLGL